MRKTNSILIISTIVLVMFASLSGCNLNPGNEIQQAPKTGASVAISVHLPDVTRGLTIDMVLVTAKRSGFTDKTANLTIGGNPPTGTGSISDMDTGTWLFIVEAKDSAGNVLYSGSAEKNLASGANSVALDLLPDVGIIQLNVSWPYAGSFADLKVTVSRATFDDYTSTGAVLQTATSSTVYALNLTKGPWSVLIEGKIGSVDYFSSTIETIVETNKIGVVNASLTQVRTTRIKYASQAGAYPGQIDVTISTDTPGASIYYTNNGSEPTTSSTLYTGTIVLSVQTTLKAIAVKAGLFNSETVLQLYSIPFGTLGIVNDNINQNAVARSTFLSGNYLYVACGIGGLKIYDVTTSISPQLIETVNASGDARDVYVSGNYAYLADGSGGLIIINVTNPANTAIVSTTFTNNAYGVWKSGNYVYVADMQDGLQIIDVSNPAAPSIAGRYDTPDTAYEVTVSGNYAYVADYTTVQIVNIANPSSPVLSGVVDVTKSYGVCVSGTELYVADDSAGLTIINIANPEMASIIKTVDTLGNAYGVTVSGGFAYVTDNVRGLDIINVTQPANAYYATTIETPGNARGEPTLKSGYCYVADDVGGLQVLNVGNYTISSYITGQYTNAYNANIRGSFVSGNYVYLAGDNVSGQGLIMLDITDPAAPTVSGAYTAGAQANYDVMVVGNYAYTANNTEGMRVFDTVLRTYVGVYNTPGNSYAVYVATIGATPYAFIADNAQRLQIINVSDPALPTLAGLWNVAGTSNSVDVYVVGNYAYLANDVNGLYIIDVSNPALPVQVGWVDTFKATGLWVSPDGNFAYIADNTQGLKIANTTNKSSPYIMGSYDTAGTAYDVSVYGNYAYLADNNYGMCVIDVSNKTFPVLVKNIYMSTARNIKVLDSGSPLVPTAFVTDTTNGFKIIKIGDVANTCITSTIETPGSAYDAFVSGNYAYVADYDRGVQIVDVSTLTSAFVVKTVDTPGNTYSVALNGNYIYASDGVFGVQIIDVSVPASAAIVKTIYTDTAYEVFIAGNYMYVADGPSGLQIVDITNPLSAYVIKTVDTTGNATGVVVASHGPNLYAYVADGGSGVQIIDVTTPSSASIVKAVDTLNTANKIKVNSTYVYVADGAAGVEVINISNPTLAYIERNVTTLNALDLNISGSYCYVADDYSGIQIFDISNPALPQIVRTQDTLGRSRGIFVLGTTIFVADDIRGLVIMSE